MTIQSADAVVIGGGAHGASAAYHLARAGRSVVLVEKGDIAAGASAQSGGIIRCHYSNEAMVRLAHRAAETWPHLADELDQPVDYVRNGLIFAVAPDDAATLKSLVAMQRRIGVETEAISAREIDSLIPGFAADGLEAAAYEAAAGYADPYSTAHAFIRRARELGATVLTDTAVTGVDRDGARVRGVQTDQGPIRTSLVVNCAGAWAARVAGMVGIDLPVRPGLIQMVAFHPHHPEWHRHSPTWVDLTTMTYCRPDTAGAMLAGGGVSENAALEAEEIDPDRCDARPPLLFEAEIFENVGRRCPWAQKARRVSAWGGVDGNSPDFHLIFGPVPGVQGYLQVVGGSGNSFKLSPATGEAVAEYVTTGTCSYLDLSAFSVTRFDSGRPFVGRYRMHIVG